MAELWFYYGWYVAAKWLLIDPHWIDLGCNVAYETLAASSSSSSSIICTLVCGVVLIQFVAELLRNKSLFLVFIFFVSELRILFTLLLLLLLLG
jgi:hypothetical protein